MAGRRSGGGWGGSSPGACEAQTPAVLWLCTPENAGNAQAREGGPSGNLGVRPRSGTIFFAHVSWAHSVLGPDLHYVGAGGHVPGTGHPWPDQWHPPSPPAAPIPLLSCQPLSCASWPLGGNLGMHLAHCSGRSHGLRVPERAGSAHREPSIPESVLREPVVRVGEKTQMPVTRSSVEGRKEAAPNTGGSAEGAHGFQGQPATRALAHISGRAPTPGSASGGKEDGGKEGQK